MKKQIGMIESNFEDFSIRETMVLIETETAKCIGVIKDIGNDHLVVEQHLNPDDAKCWQNCIVLIMKNKIISIVCKKDDYNYILESKEVKE